MLKEERQRRIVDLLRQEGRVIAADLPGRLGVSGHTVRRDLEELAEAGALRRVHGGAVPRSPVASTYAERAREDGIVAMTEEERAEQYQALRAAARAAVPRARVALYHIDEFVY